MTGNLTKYLMILSSHPLPYSGIAKDALKDAEAQLASAKTKATASGKALSAAQQKATAADSSLSTAGNALKQSEDKLAQKTKQVRVY